MKKKIGRAVLGLGVLLSVLGIVAQPCGFGRLVFIDSWSRTVNVEVFSDKVPLWSGQIGGGPPRQVRVHLPGDVAYRVRATNMETGEVREGTFGYDSDGMSQMNLFLIDRAGIHFHEWMIQPLWKALALLGFDTLSCVDGR